MGNTSDWWCEHGRDRKTRVGVVVHRTVDVITVGHIHVGGDWCEGRHVERGVQAPISLIQLKDDGLSERKFLSISMFVYHCTVLLGIV